MLCVALEKMSSHSLIYRLSGQGFCVARSAGWSNHGVSNDSSNLEPANTTMPYSSEEPDYGCSLLLLLTTRILVAAIHHGIDPVINQGNPFIMLNTTCDWWHINAGILSMYAE